jgi:hypothetical protein
MAEQIIIKISSTDTGAGIEANKSVITGGKANLVKDNQTPKKAGEKDVWGDITKTIVIDQARKVLTESINQYIDLTGNNNLRNKANLATTMLSYGTMIASGGLVGVVAVAVDIGLKAGASNVETRKANAQVELLRQRVGSSNINGGRNTYD